MFYSNIRFVNITMNDLCKCVNCSHDWLYLPWSKLPWLERTKEEYDYNLSVTIMKALQ